MKKFGKYFANVFAVLVLVVGLIPSFNSVHAAANGVEIRLQQVYADIQTKFANGVFSVNGRDCYTNSNHTCTNCNLYTIVSDRLGEDLAAFKKKSADGYQCAAFAKYVFVKTFGSCKETTDRYNIGSGQSASTYNTLKTGDLFYTSNHWMIYLSHNNSGVTVMDANGAGDLKIANKKTYAYSHSNLSGQVTVWHSNHWSEVNEQYAVSADTEKPVVNNIQITDVSSSGFTVSCTVIDNVGVTRVQFPAWSTIGGGDDLIANWKTSSAATGTKSGSTWTYRVNTNIHNNETGEYAVRVYACDAAGNYAYTSPMTVIVHDGYTITYDINGGSNKPANQIKEIGEVCQLSSFTPYRDGYQFKGWRAIFDDPEWNAVSTSSENYQTEYLYYTYGGEANGDPTCWYGEFRSDIESEITTKSKIRYFYTYRSSNEGEPIRLNNVTLPYVDANGNTGTAKITNTLFYYGGPVYRAVLPTEKIYQPGDTYTYDTDVVLQAVWEKENKNKWVLDNGEWKYLIDDSYYAVGWKDIDGTWYYFNYNGIMQTGWLLQGNSWYYLNGSGAMQTGWLYDGAWYYLSSSGAMQTGWLYDGAWYYLNSSGAMQTGWLYDGAWYYLNSSGAMQTGWLLLGNTWYYLDSSGRMVTGVVFIDGTYYSFTTSGAWDGTTRELKELRSIQVFSKGGDGLISYNKYWYTKDNLGNQYNYSLHGNYRGANEFWPARSYNVYYLGGGYSRLTGTFYFTGRDETTQTDEFTLLIYADDVLIYSAETGEGCMPQEVDINLQGVQMLKVEMYTSVYAGLGNCYIY